MGNNGWKSNCEIVKNCLFYKKMLGIFFIVDVFKFGVVEGCKVYFFIYFYSDYYGGFIRLWFYGFIFCIEIIVCFVLMYLGVDLYWLCLMKFGCVFIVEGVKV